MNKEKLLFYKESDLVICLRITNSYYSEIDSVISKKTILSQMKKIIQFLSVSDNIDENYKIPLNVKNQINKLIMASNRIILREIYKSLFPKSENKNKEEERELNDSNAIL